MSGVKGKSGRKHKTLTRERALQCLTQKLPKAIETISDTMEGTISDRLRYEAAIEIKDSVMGKPKIQAELTGNVKLGAAEMLAVFKVIAESRRKQIEGGQYAIQITGGEEEARQGLHSEEKDDRV